MRLNRLAYIAKSKIPSRHANSVQVMNMIRAFAPLVDTLDVYLPGNLGTRLRCWSGRLFAPYGCAQPANAHFHFLPNRRSPKRNFERATLQAFHPADLVFTRSARLALELAEIGHTVLFESHVVTRDAELVPLEHLLRALTLAPASGVVSISPAVTNAYRDAGLDPARILTVHSSVDVPAFLNQPAGGLKKLFGPEVYARPILLYTGSLKEEKGARFLAEAAAHLREYHVVIVGGTSEEIARIRAGVNTRPNLFTHPAVPHKHIPGILQDAQALVMPYMSDGTITTYMSPLKMFEYLATGKPVLSADLPAMHSVLRHEANALLFSPGSVSALREQVERLMHMDNSRIHALRENQLKSVEHLSWAHRAKTILDWHHNFSQSHNRRQR